jgi:cytochrome c-type biogenesis protein
MSFEELTEAGGGGRRAVAVAVLKSLPFVAGFSLVFIVLGASASALGAVMRAHLALLKKVAGVGIVLLGLHLAGWLPLPGLMKERRIRGEVAAPGTVRAFVAGVCFAFGWTPCVGPILAGILALAATGDTLSRGVFLLAAYSLGLGVPFILSAAFLNGFLSVFRGAKRHLRQVEVVAGLLLVVMGAAVFADKLAWLSAKMQFLNPEQILVVDEPSATAEALGDAPAEPADAPPASR